MTYYYPKECESSYISNNIKILFNENYKVISTSFIKKNTVILIEVPLFNLFGLKINNMIIQMLYILLKNKDNKYITQNNIRSYGHQLYTETTKKVALSCRDDKVFICDDNVKTYNHGHYKTKII